MGILPTAKIICTDILLLYTFISKLDNYTVSQFIQYVNYVYSLYTVCIQYVNLFLHRYKNILTVDSIALYYLKFEILL